MNFALITVAIDGVRGSARNSAPRIAFSDFLSIFCRRFRNLSFARMNSER